jgi:hypothetical protein
MVILIKIAWGCGLGEFSLLIPIEPSVLLLSLATLSQTQLCQTQTALVPVSLVKLSRPAFLIEVFQNVDHWTRLHAMV